MYEGNKLRINIDPEALAKEIGVNVRSAIEPTLEQMKQRIHDKADALVRSSQRG